MRELRANRGAARHLRMTMQGAKRYGSDISISDNWSGPIPVGRAEIETIERFVLVLFNETSAQSNHCVVREAVRDSQLVANRSVERRDT